MECDWRDICNNRYKRFRVTESLRKKYAKSSEEDLWRESYCYKKVIGFLERKPATCLDIGCGVGRISIRFAKEGIKTLGIDIDPEIIEICSLRKEEENLGDYLNFEVFDISERPFDRKFELILCLNVLEHIKDDAAALKNMALCIANGGYICISVPNKLSVINLISDPHYHVPFVALMSNKCANFVVSRILRKICGVDVQRCYTASSLIRLCNSVGLKVRNLNAEDFHKEVINSPKFFRRILKVLSRIGLLSKFLEWLYVTFCVRSYLFLLYY
ncbi:MAG: hypothetical protein A2987_04430 [Omnitrophica bacterium RIFCSPLOWO2_01_FULL_45_10]|nr:MAG: hypothetical protein A2987_04430 [Omnitrophica bacterium RIFCSPLOWO2_01_FULL_45_10]